MCRPQNPSTCNSVVECRSEPPADECLNLRSPTGHKRLYSACFLRDLVYICRVSNSLKNRTVLLHDNTSMNVLEEVMKHHKPLSTLLLLAFIALVFSSNANALQIDDASTHLKAGQLDRVPLAFTENQGQWDERVKFCANAGSATMWFTTDGIYYQFTRSSSTSEGIDEKEISTLGPYHRTDYGPDEIEQLVIKAAFVGARQDIEITGEGLMEYRCNYFLGDDPAKWQADVPNYTSIRFKDIYPGIDLRFSGAGNGKAAYEFIAKPDADLSQIKIDYEGVNELFVDENGDMIARTAWGNIISAIAAPADRAGTATYSLLLSTETEIGITTADKDAMRSAPLAITLDYSTYLGGSGGSYIDDRGYAIVVDDFGAAYVTGYTRSTDFPTVNPYQGTLTGSHAVFVTKFSPDGSSLVYSTYLGGGLDDRGIAIAIDGSGAAYVTGWTQSLDFPTTVNPFQADQGSIDAFVSKLSSSGSSLVFSTYLGGGDMDQANGIVVDGSGMVYVSGSTSSTNFPTLNPYQGTFQGNWWDGFVTKFSSSGNSLVYSTYLGGDSTDLIEGMVVNGSGEAFVVGHTHSTNFPTQNPYQGTFQGIRDAFVTKLAATGSSLVYSTYLGGTRGCICNGMDGIH